MQSGSERLRVVVLGGTSRVWQAMVPHWRTSAEARIDTCVWARRAGPGVDVISALDDVRMVLPQCDCVAALWGVTSGPEDALAQNSTLALRAQEIARALGAKTVLHAMSAAVYTPSDLPLHEEADTQPRHAYGMSKLNAERALAGQKPTPVILRLGNVAGTDGLAAAVRQGKPLKLDQFESGDAPRRSYIAPDDLAEVFCRLALQADGLSETVVNVAGPTPVAMDAVLTSAGVPFSYQPAPETALPLQHLDVTRLATLGIEFPNSADPAHLAKFLSVPEVPL